MSLIIHKKPEGMTLIELLVVMSILVILMILSLAYLKTSTVSGATRMIFYDMQYARMQAITKRMNVRLLFNSVIGVHVYDGHTYKIHSDTDRDGIVDEGEDLTIRDIRGDFKGTRFISNSNVIFNPVGTSNSGTVTVTDGKKIKQIVFYWTGRMRIQ